MVTISFGVGITTLALFQNSASGEGRRDGSAVPPGQTFSLGLAFPALETPGYFQESLRDLGPIALHAFPFWDGYCFGRRYFVALT
jgi:hypothetical protein